MRANAGHTVLQCSGRAGLALPLGRRPRREALGRVSYPPQAEKRDVKCELRCVALSSVGLLSRKPDKPSPREGK